MWWADIPRKVRCEYAYLLTKKQFFISQLDYYWGSNLKSVYQIQISVKTYGQTPRQLFTTPHPPKMKNGISEATEDCVRIFTNLYNWTFPEIFFIYIVFRWSCRRPRGSKVMDKKYESWILREARQKWVISAVSIIENGK